MPATAATRNNNSASENNAADEQVTVSPASPAITTTPSVTTVTLGTTSVTLKDTAVSVGRLSRDGHDHVHAVPRAARWWTPRRSTVNGNGTYTTPTGYTLPTTGTVTGTYQWDASYSSGNGNNAGASDVNDSNDARESVPDCRERRCRSGVHHQPLHIVVTFSGQVHSARAENINNYHLYTLSRDGKFRVPVRVTSAVYDPATNGVTLRFAHSYNVHHLAEITVTNPCPGCPSFSGILNRKYALGDIDDHGKIIVLPKTDIPGVLNPSVLPKVLTPANRPLVLRLSKEPQSAHFTKGTRDLAQSASRRTCFSGNREGRDRRLIRICSLKTTVWSDPSNRERFAVKRREVPEVAVPVFWPPIPGDIARITTCSPSWRVSDYAASGREGLAIGPSRSRRTRHNAHAARPDSVCVVGHRDPMRDTASYADLGIRPIGRSAASLRLEAMKRPPA